MLCKRAAIYAQNYSLQWDKNRHLSVAFTKQTICIAMTVAKVVTELRQVKNGRR